MADDNKDMNKPEQPTKDQRVSAAYQTMMALVNREIQLGFSELIKILSEK